MRRAEGVEAEKRLVGNLFFLAGARSFVGLRFKYKPPGALGRIFVKVTGLSPGNARFELQALEGGETFSAVPATELSIGVNSRREDDPLIKLLRETGMREEQFIQKRDETGAREREQEDGSRGRGLLRNSLGENLQPRSGFELGPGRNLPQIRTLSLGREPEDVEDRSRHPERIPERSQSRGRGILSEAERGGLRHSREEATNRDRGGPPGFERVQDNQWQVQGNQREGSVTPQSAYRTARNALVQSPTRQKEAPFGSDLVERMAELERQMKANRAKSGMEAEMKRYGAAINPHVKPGLFANAELMWSIYTAPEKQRGPITIAGYFGNVLKTRSIRAGAYLAEDLLTFAQRKARTLADNASPEQVAEVEQEVLQFFQEKKVKEEDVLAKHPEWLDRENR